MIPPVKKGPGRGLHDLACARWFPLLTPGNGSLPHGRRKETRRGKEKSGRPGVSGIPGLVP